MQVKIVLHLLKVMTDLLPTALLTHLIFKTYHYAHRENHHQQPHSNAPLSNEHSRLGNSLLTLAGGKETSGYKQFEIHEFFFATAKIMQIACKEKYLSRKFDKFYHRAQVYGKTDAKIQIQKLFLQNITNFAIRNKI